VTAAATPDRVVTSRDGTPIAIFESGTAATGTRPLVLVHGTTSDHLTFRVVGPRLGLRRRLFAIDRRGRGASGDGPGAYSIAREFEDVAAVTDALAAKTGGPVDVIGHSFGGRTALGAALLTQAIGKVVSYEGAPAAPGRPYQDPELVDRLLALLERGDPEGVLESFMRAIVGFDDEAMARFRADPVWPLRVAAAHTIVRELREEVSPVASLEELGRVRNPVLQVLGTESRRPFHEATEALDNRLADGTIARIRGAAHGAHHSHPDAFVTVVEAFLDGRSLEGGPA
jgi:pimeloyl-ACP methyl ester carboxylesterase